VLTSSEIGLRWSTRAEREIDPFGRPAANARASAWRCASETPSLARTAGAGPVVAVTAVRLSTAARDRETAGASQM